MIQLLVLAAIIIVFSGTAALIIGIVALNRLSRQSSKIKRLEGQVSALAGKSSVSIKPTPVNAQPTKPSSGTSVSTFSKSTSHKSDVWPDSITDKKPAVSFQKTNKKSWLSKSFRWVINFFTSGNSFVRIGALILFLGFGFLLKYTANSDYFPVSYRLICAGLGAAALMVLGWRLKDKRRGYALSLQGTSFGLLYLLAFSIYYYFHYTTAPIALGMVLALSFALMFASIIQNAKYLALISVIGAFISPLLIPFGVAEHPSLLFSYYLLINIAILGIALFKSWRELSVIGFIFTFGLCSLWHYQYYSSADFVVVETFMFIQFLFYVALPILYFCKQKTELKKYLILPLIYAVPLVVFALQAYLLDYQLMALALSAIALGVFYLLLWATARRYPALKASYLSQSYLIIGMFFLTIACPLALSGSLSQTILAIEGLVLMFAGNRFQRNSALISGIVLLVVSALQFVIVGVNLGPYWFNSTLVTGLTLGLVFVASAYILYSNTLNGSAWTKTIAFILFPAGLIFWYGVQYIDINAFVNFQLQSAAYLLTLSITALLCGVANRWLTWPLLRSTLMVLLAGMVVLAFRLIAQIDFPIFCLLSWILALTVAYAGIYQIRQSSSVNIHLLLAWLLTAVLTKLLFTFLPLGLECLAYGLAPAIMLLTTRLFLQAGWWPVKQNFTQYMGRFIFPMLVILAAWLLAVNSFNPTTLLPWFYLPMLNPIDLSCVAVLSLSGLWLYSINKTSQSNQVIPMASCFMFFIIYWLTFVLLRSLHIWAHVPFYLPAIIDSTLTQLCLTVLWSSMALVAIILATIKGWRLVWFLGVSMLGLVIVKLFFLDLSNTNTLFRIFTFIGVGMLMLLIGYISPLPPRRIDSKQSVTP